MEIKINNLKDIPAKLYNKDNKLVGEIKTILDFYDVRVQIKDKQLTGYHFVFDGQHIRIDRNGNCEEWPEGLFSLFTDLALKLL